MQSFLFSSEVNHFEGRDDLKKEYGFQGFSGSTGFKGFTGTPGKTNGRYDGSEGTAADRAPIPPSGTSGYPSSITITVADDRTPKSQSQYIFIAAGLCAVLLVLASNNRR
jgi:hypothetical protein